MRQQVMSRQEKLGELDWYAAQLDLDEGRFEDCLKTNKYLASMVKDRILAGMLRISRVPTLVVAKTYPDNPLKFKGITFIGGAQPFSNIQKEIDTALGELGQ